MPVKVSRRPFRPANRTEGRSCSIVTMVACILLIMWLVFVGYAWNAGLLGKSQVVDNKNTEVMESLSKSEGSVNKDKNLRQEVQKESNVSPDHLIEREISDIHIIFSTDCNPYQV